MTKDKVIRILTQFNDWRRGNEDECCYTPAEVGRAIDTAIELLSE